MLKPIFDTSDQCGQPNALLTLSRNFGHSRIAAGIEQSLLQQQTADGAGESFAREYLSNNGQAPGTFDMRQLLAKLPAPQQKVEQSSRSMEELWEEARQKGLASNWSEQFLQNNQNLTMHQKWADEFSQQQQNGAETDAGKQQLEMAWQNAQSASTWAKDFLARYDNSNASSSTADQLLLANKENGMVDEWEKEFLKYMANLANGQAGQNQQEMAFFDYESAWDAVHSKDAQEKYAFTEENPFVGELDSVEKARQTFGEGRMAESILHYEAALQKEPGNVEIWHSLGLALAENEDDPRAISAQRNVLKLNPRHKDALLALSVSLANESFDHLALSELHKWICVYEGREPQDSHENSALYRQYVQLDRTEFIELEQHFLSLAGQSDSFQADSDLKNAMSVLYNLGRDYDRAVDCIRAALSSRPEDPVLWNRLGATLANADRSAESVSAYKHALQLFPAYVRARYNLGIACMNLNSYRDAARHFVTALQIQHMPDQSQIWSKLRSALIRMDSFEMSAECFEALDQRDLTRIIQFIQITN